MRILFLAALLALTACAHQPCTMNRYLVDPNCR